MEQILWDIFFSLKYIGSQVLMADLVVYSLEFISCFKVLMRPLVLFN